MSGSLHTSPRGRAHLLAGVVAVLMVLVGTGCPRRGARTETPSSTPFDAMEYREAPLPRGAKVFLVAGGDDVANFAAEIVEQRRLWSAAGLEPDEIVCYYAKPTRRAWKEDRAQYDRVAEALADCRRAEPARLRRDLLDAARQQPPFVYLYVSTHGLDSLLRIARNMYEAGDADWYPSLTEHERGILDQHVLALQAGPSPPLEDIEGIVEALRGGADPRDLLVTPSYLAETLEAFPSDTLAIVVLQGCFSGGFIGHDPAPREATRDHEGKDLRSVPRVIALVATAQNRPSFGCSAGDRRTYFGGAVTRALARTLEPGMQPPDVPWERVFEQTAQAVDTMESIRGERPSLPGFYSSVEAEKRTQPDAAATPE